MALKASHVVAKFETDFRELLPRSFVDILFYLRAKYGATLEIAEYSIPYPKDTSLSFLRFLSRTNFPF